MIDLQHLRAWSYRRQLLDRSGALPLAALQSVVAVHGTQPPAPLSLLARTPAMTYEQFAALEQDRRAVRMPAMRGSVHLLPATAAPKIFAATRTPDSRLASTLKWGGMTLDEYRQMKPRLLAMVKEPVEGSDIRKSLGLSESEFLAVRLMTRDAEVLRLATTPRTDRLQYVATDAWLGAPLAEVDVATALTWLVEAYLLAFGPTRIKDAAWWIGSGLGKTKQAIALVETIDLGDGYLLPAALRSEFDATQPIAADAIAVLPKWDSYTMGYAPDGRQRFVDDHHLASAYSTGETKKGATSGDGWPSIMRGGRAVARWEHRFDGHHMIATLMPFPGEKIDPAEVMAPLQEIATFMRCQELTVETESV